MDVLHLAEVARMTKNRSQILIVVFRLFVSSSMLEIPNRFFVRQLRIDQPTYIAKSNERFSARYTYLPNFTGWFLIFFFFIRYPGIVFHVPSFKLTYTSYAIGKSFDRKRARCKKAYRSAIYRDLS